MKRVFMLAAMALAAAVSVVGAEPAPYKIDVTHSEVGFRVRHFFSKTPGRFNDYAGTVMFDDKNLANSSVDVTIQTASIYTNNEKRDGHLKSDDFFAAEKFPTLTFKSTKIEPGEGNKFKLHGDLTMRGVTKPVVLDAELVGMGNVGQAGTRAGFAASTTVNRKDYGILWNRTLDQGGTMLDDMVSIEIQVEAIKQEPQAATKEAPKEPAKPVGSK
jgi:polyisoprenoid-binding protein YceI